MPYESTLIGRARVALRHVFAAALIVALPACSGCDDEEPTPDVSVDAGDTSTDVDAGGDTDLDVQDDVEPDADEDVEPDVDEDVEPDVEVDTDVDEDTDTDGDVIIIPDTGDTDVTPTLNERQIVYPTPAGGIVGSETNRMVIQVGGPQPSGTASSETNSITAGPGAARP